MATQEGPDSVLLTCDETNVASAKAIERVGSMLEDTRTDADGRPFRRYWIEISGPHN